VRIGVPFVLTIPVVAATLVVSLLACSSSETLCTTEVFPSELSGDLPIVDPPKTLEKTHDTGWRIGNYALVGGPAIRVGYSREGLADFANGDPIFFTLIVDSPEPGAKAKYELAGQVDGVTITDDGCRRFAKGKIVPR
jgi:hypothetical protein